MLSIIVLILLSIAELAASWAACQSASSPGDSGLGWGTPAVDPSAWCEPTMALGLATAVALTIVARVFEAYTAYGLAEGPACDAYGSG